MADKKQISLAAKNAIERFEAVDGPEELEEVFSWAISNKQSFMKDHENEVRKAWWDAMQRTFCFPPIIKHPLDFFQQIS